MTKDLHDRSPLHLTENQASIPAPKLSRPQQHVHPHHAEAAARAVLSGQASAVPKDRDGAVDALRALTMARSSAVKAITQASNQIKALLVGSPEPLREQLTVKSLLQLATRCADLNPNSGMHTTLRSLGRRWLFLHEEIIELDTQIRTLVRRTIPTLITRPGIGIHSAAQLLITAGGNPGRLHSDAAFAALCGASPVQASSGQRHRHRLNRGGDRSANNALWTIANNRLIHDPTTREFAAKRRLQGDNRNEIPRILKRYIARDTFNLIIVDLRPTVALAVAC